MKMNQDMDKIKVLLVWGSIRIVHYKQANKI